MKKKKKKKKNRGGRTSTDSMPSETALQVGVGGLCWHKFEHNKGLQVLEQKLA